jgi:bla regulator protein BlaR1
MLDIVWNHLWQSTVFVAAVALLTLAFRRNRAQVRYCLWLAASVKFLIPFSALLWLGTQIELIPIERSGQTIVGFLDNAVQPFTQPQLERVNPRGRPVPPSPRNPMLTAAVRGVTIIWPAGTLAVLLIWAVRWRRVAGGVGVAPAVTSGPVVEILRRLDAPHLRVVSSNRAVEPGVFGITRPVLIWPAGIAQRLNDGHVEAILAHEVAHVRRRDNLAAVIHMAVEAIFWFHPLVWWIGARLIDERERACDEDVVQRGTEPDVYAESILRTVQFYVESPLACVAGVTGSDLKKRVEAIMRSEATMALNGAKRVLLGAALIAAIAVPVAIGIVTSPRVAAQIVAPTADSPTFDVASVKPSDPGAPSLGRGVPGRFTSQNMTAARMIRQAYDIHDSQIIGGPDWVKSQGYTIDATTGGKPPDQMRLMLQTLLRDRFKLAFHTEKRDMSIYALVVLRSDGRLGPGLMRIPDDECPPPGGPRRGGPPPAAATGPPPSPFDPNAVAPCGSIIFGPGRLLAHGVPIDMLTRSLANLPAITSFNRPVTNLTKLEGVYDFDFRWTNEFGRGGPPPAGAPPAGPAGAPNPGDEPALFTALQEQLGLKLNSQRATLDVLVIDSIERPSEN